MACHEIGALRLALMNVLGGSREAERQHEEAELGEALQSEGPVRSLASARTLEDALSRFQDAVADLEQHQAEMKSDDPKLYYARTLIVAVKGAESNLRRLRADIQEFYRGLEELHDLIHEIYPPQSVPSNET